jgi:hypothetical protein
MATEPTVSNVVSFPTQPSDPNEAAEFLASLNRPLLDVDQLLSAPIDTLAEAGPLVLVGTDVEQTFRRITAIVNALNGLARFTLTHGVQAIRVLLDDLEDFDRGC